MTAPHIVDPYELLTQAVGDASPDLLRTLLQTTINMLLSADADAVVGAEYGVPTPDRVSMNSSGFCSYVFPWIAVANTGLFSA